MIKPDATLPSIKSVCLWHACLLSILLGGADAGRAEDWKGKVTVYRDAFGVPHIEAEDQPSSAYALGYTQAEDYFWQVEDSIAWGLGRYAELYGKSKIEDDLVTHAFEIPKRSEVDAASQPEASIRMAEAFAAGLNAYMADHPEVKPRLITKFEPWHLLAFGRRVYMEICFRAAHVSDRYMPGKDNEIYEQIGSNAWAVGPSKTAAGTTMLFINPHQPWYGYGQWYEAHIRTKDGIDFYGATFFCSPALSIGHNKNCGWSFTVNEPDCVDAWRVRFDNPEKPDEYRHGDTRKMAERWTTDIKIKGAPSRRYTFRKTHHGPILRALDDQTFEAVAVAKLYENDFIGEVMQMNRAKTVHDIRSALGKISIPIFNCVAADGEGNILYVYNGVVPKRDPRFDWSKPVDGNDPATDWQGFHPVEELPQILNPPSGYVQSCNASPFTTTDDGNPFKDDFPAYMVLDKDIDKRRSKMSRKLLRDADDLNLDQFEKLGFDTTLYWAWNELPQLREDFDRLASSNPTLHAKCKEYMSHFDGWDCVVTADCTRSPLCAAWYEELYGFGYPAERLKDEFKIDPDKRFEALTVAAGKLVENYGTWQPKWADIYRIQRHHNVSDLLAIPLSDKKPSLPCVGAPGPLGTIFTVYYSPSIYVPLLREMRKHYAVVGTSYMGVVEFGKEGVVGTRSLIQFGSSSDPKSPHYDDQAKMMSERRLKPSLFDWQAIHTQAKRKYQPGMAP